MRRIDVITITLGVFVAGGIIYLILQQTGLDSLSAGIWSQVILVGGLLGWVISYLWRVVNSKMTYNQQVKDYQEAFLAKRLASLTEEELEKLQAEIAQENSPTQK
jgi:hypothetical protein